MCLILVWASSDLPFLQGCGKGENAQQMFISAGVVGAEARAMKGALKRRKYIHTRLQGISNPPLCLKSLFPPGVSFLEISVVTGCRLCPDFTELSSQNVRLNICSMDPNLVWKTILGQTILDINTAK